MYSYGNAIATIFASNWKIRSGFINSHHEGILNKHLRKNLFEENRMPVFLLRFEYRSRRLNSNKESHWLQVSGILLKQYGYAKCQPF